MIPRYADGSVIWKDTIEISLFVLEGLLLASAAIYALAGK